MEKLLYSKIIGEGKPMIIMHGYLGMSDNWKTLGARFAEAGFQVHLLDLRNHGRSFHSSDFNYTYMSEDVANYCAHHNLKDVTLIGHSMGGKVAMFTACEYPDLVDKMIVADISPKSYPPHHQERRQQSNPSWRRKRSSDRDSHPRQCHRHHAITHPQRPHLHPEKPHMETLFRSLDVPHTGPPLPSRPVASPFPSAKSHTN